MIFHPLLESRPREHPQEMVADDDGVRILKRLTPYQSVTILSFQSIFFTLSNRMFILIISFS